MPTYRQTASLRPLIGWNLLAVPALLALFKEAGAARRDEAWGWYGLAGLLLLMGPVSLLVYLLRCGMVRLELGDGGLILSGRRELPWSGIRTVELRGWRPGPWNPVESLKLGGCGWVLFIVLFKLMLFLIFMVLLAWILRAVLLPVVVLYSPWNTRVVIGLRDGSTLVYRDLSDAEDLVRSVEARL